MYSLEVEAGCCVCYLVNRVFCTYVELAMDVFLENKTVAVSGIPSPLPCSGYHNVVLQCYS